LPAFEGENKEKRDDKQKFCESAFMFHFLVLKRPQPEWLPWLRLGPDVVRLFFYFASKVPFLSYLLSLTRMERSSDGKGLEEKQGVTECARWKYVEKH
jgi:hypothetical protein